MWKRQPDFVNVITHVWGNNPLLENAVNFFAQEVSAWACTRVDNIFKRKAKLLSRIQGIQKSDNYYHNTFLRNLERDLIAEFNLILKMKTDY